MVRFKNWKTSKNWNLETDEVFLVFGWSVQSEVKKLHLVLDTVNLVSLGIHFSIFSYVSFSHFVAKMKDFLMKTTDFWQRWQIFFIFRCLHQKFHHLCQCLPCILMRRCLYWACADSNEGIPSTEHMLQSPCAGTLIHTDKTDWIFITQGEIEQPSDYSLHAIYLFNLLCQFDHDNFSVWSWQAVVCIAYSFEQIKNQYTHFIY